MDLEGPLGLLVEAEDVVDVADVALEDGDVVADVGQRVVDLVRHAGDHLAERRELLGLDELALGELELVVGGLDAIADLGMHVREAYWPVRAAGIDALRDTPGIDQARIEHAGPALKGLFAMNTCSSM